ncbi:MAG: pyridoxal-dependent decarboxylase [Bacteroidota bacterium]
MSLNFDDVSRTHIVRNVFALLEDYYANPERRQVAKDWDMREIKQYAQQIEFSQSNPSDAVLRHVIEGLDQYAVHTPHPNYFGLFNPRSNFASILADLITAVYNPQLAAWSHAPFANEIERFVIEAFGKRIGYAETVDGTFCTGGAEANLTAILCALNQAFPNFNESGLSALDGQPMIFCSSESHHSIHKAAMTTGLGTKAVQSIPVDKNFQMDLVLLKQQIVQDLENGNIPLMVIGTAGTTGLGAVDDLKSINDIAKDYQMWFHIDAAYGGAIATSQQYKSVVSGIELGDSVTIDLHKWFSVPMGASIFLTKNRKILHQTFSVKTAYMPKDGDVDQVVDPYVHSIQWSRRFIGLKIYLPLAIHGWQGYEQTINRQVEIAQLLRDKLLSNGWIIRNNTLMPIICFTRPEFQDQEMVEIVNEINASGKAWLSVYPIDGKPTARVCITNYLTDEAALDHLVEVLEAYSLQTI